MTDRSKKISSGDGKKNEKENEETKENLLTEKRTQKKNDTCTRKKENGGRLSQHKTL